MKLNKFKGKTSSGEWIEGNLIIENAECYIYDIENNSHPKKVDAKSVFQFVNQNYKCGKEVFEGDIGFIEIEGQHGDIRLYNVCTYIKEWSAWSWLNDFEYILYLNGHGVDDLDFAFKSTFTMEGSDKYTHAGNLIDNLNLIENE